ncbi:hypothetical protein MNEG_2486 [Monoraphidium neglectum]|jgi:hypothetical protein|uniref:Uncharacterized protein n=1 Tax=Monoraphidium neglectum TaxID=145388 RepID=A0A0D2MYP7_9CHLO|nr:hypothetical protein MNEG_2486 [Monoraphidium neglectum]KIZ05477.1 hypothetical protein MNEG_2486 [Monoraphidium neglectum]|eukprot:XP_013904496.1 hypothetical protein MNEG_2486 [Monoraphidium neglectum]
MTALMRLLVEATGPHGDARGGGGVGGGGGGGGSEPLWLAAATERDRRLMALWAIVLADGAMKVVSIRTLDARDRDDADSRQLRRSAIALTEAFCAAPGAAAAFIAAAASEESLRLPEGAVFDMFHCLSLVERIAEPLKASAELTNRIASQLEPCAIEAAALAFADLRIVAMADRRGGRPLSLGLLELLSHSDAGAAALLRLPPAEGLGLLVPFLAPREPGDGCSGRGRGGSAAGGSAAADARRGAPAGASSGAEARLTVLMEAITVIQNVFKRAVLLEQHRRWPGGAEAAPPGSSRSASDGAPPESAAGNGLMHASAVVGALTGPLIEVVAGRGAAAGLRGKPIWDVAFYALEALERSIWVVVFGAWGPAAGADVEWHEPPALFLHPGSAAALATTLRGALEAAAHSSSSGNNSGVAVVEAARLLFGAAMANPGRERTQWCREAVTAGLPSLLLRAAVQVSTKLNGPADAARAAATVCLMAYAGGDEPLGFEMQHVRHDQAPGGEPLSAIRARALEALMPCAGSGCPEAAMLAAAGALHACQDSSSAAADLAAHPGAATAVVGALLRCAAAARAAGPSGGGGRLAAGAHTTMQLLSVMALAVDDPRVEAADAGQQQQRRLPEAAARGARDDIEGMFAEAEAALLRLGAAREPGGALAADTAAALGFLRRREAPSPLPLPGPGPLSRADDRRCLVCGRGRGDGVTLRRCSGCRAEGVFYCSVEW